MQSGTATTGEPLHPMQHAEFLKNKGNTAFAEKRYPDAIQLYTDCLALRPDLAVVFANRAAAYIKLKQYAPAEADCSKAIELDNRWVKKNFIFLWRSRTTLGWQQYGGQQPALWHVASGSRHVGRLLAAAAASLLTGVMRAGRAVVW